jgi:hypothetical protein
MHGKRYYVLAKTIAVMNAAAVAAVTISVTTVIQTARSMNTAITASPKSYCCMT